MKQPCRLNETNRKIEYTVLSILDCLKIYAWSLKGLYPDHDTPRNNIVCFYTSLILIVVVNLTKCCDWQIDLFIIIIIRGLLEAILLGDLQIPG